MVSVLQKSRLVITPKPPPIDILKINNPSLNDWIGLKSILTTARKMAPIATADAGYKQSQVKQLIERQ